MVHILKNSKPETNPNISRQQLTAVKNLQKDSLITVVPTRKGKAAVVVMDMVEYTEKISALWNDDNTYKKLGSVLRIQFTQHYSAQQALQKAVRGYDTPVKPRRIRCF